LSSGPVPAGAGDVRAEPLASYCAEEPVRHGLVLGYGAIRADRIGQGLARLRKEFGR
jgi:DNA-binding transcriptional MocR family regulator